MDNSKKTVEQTVPALAAPPAAPGAAELPARAAAIGAGAAVGIGAAAATAPRFESGWPRSKPTESWFLAWWGGVQPVFF